VNHGFSCRKHQTISKPWFVRRLWDKFRRNPLKGGTVSGIYVKEKWMRLYIERWLKAPAQVEEGVYSFDDAQRDEHESVFRRVA